ncbi:hypothetical protein [Bradyrhizobium prioriisuperbiae]|uniref:hypothetical protein n=1 Tax=Bradyrhizobium prioriisuperbiae TaxID=2854389 RepID=UPI0028EE7417|nr:hypothetical protein [Bradyrhizobium prioritasuperba]
MAVIQSSKRSKSGDFGRDAASPCRATHPLLWALRAVPTETMAAFVVVFLSVLTGCLFGAAAGDLAALFTPDAGGRTRFERGLGIVALGAFFPAALIYRSPQIWPQAPIWYTMVLSIVTFVVIVSSEPFRPDKRLRQEPPAPWKNTRNS